MPPHHPAPPNGVAGDHMSAAIPGQAPPSTSTLHLPTLPLDSGTHLTNIPLTYSQYGAAIAPTGDNVVLVGHSLTSDSRIDQWWAEMMSSDGTAALDTTRYCIICFNYLGSPYGSFSPRSSGAPRSPDFPRLTVRDNVRAQVEALRLLGVRKLAFVIGGSMGGMLALEMAVTYPEWVGGLVVIAGCARHDAWQIGLNEAQRASIRADRDWRDGEGEAKDGLAAARMLAMLSYRTSVSYTEKFCAKAADGVSPVVGYLGYNGGKFANRFDAACYVQMTHTLDSMDVWRGRDMPHDRIDVTCPTMIVAVDSDQLYPLQAQKAMSAAIQGSEFHLIESPHGHDSFLIEIVSLNERVRGFLDRHSL